MSNLVAGDVAGRATWEIPWETGLPGTSQAGGAPWHQPVLATNFLDRRFLSDRVAMAIYRRRWGVAVFGQSFKQTFGECGLGSAAPQNARQEL